MADDVVEKNSGPQLIDSGSESEKSEDPTPVKKPAPAKRKLGPKPAAKRKIVSSDSENSPVKKVISLINGNKLKC